MSSHLRRSRKQAHLNLPCSATALFTCPYPDQDPVENVHAFGFGKPILDFVVGQDNHIWVLLDAQWSSGLPESSSNMIRVVKLFNGEVCRVFLPTPLLLTISLLHS